MYLAKHVVGWSTTCIGRFYHGRDHSTVIYSIHRIEALRESDPEVDALVSELKDELARQQQGRDGEMKAEPTPKVLKPSAVSFDDLADAIAERIWAVISERLQK